jgi:hypothetical protein
MDAAAVVFAVDCVGLIALNLYLGFDSSDILDYLFHIYVMYYLISGSIAAHKLAKMPPEEPVSMEAGIPQMVSEPAAEEIPADAVPAEEASAEAAPAEETPAEQVPAEEAPAEEAVEETQNV